MKLLLKAGIDVWKWFPVALVPPSIPCFESVSLEHLFGALHTLRYIVSLQV